MNEWSGWLRWLRRIAVVCVLFALWMLAARHHASKEARAEQAGETSVGGAKNGLKSISIALVADPDTLDPTDINTTETLNVARMLWGTLYHTLPDGRLVPYLAESSTLSADGREIQFKLRPGLRCEDGSPLTARDVAYSFNRAADPKLGFTGNAVGFIIPALGYQGARIDDPLTVTLLLKKYNPIALGLTSELMIMCRRPYERMSQSESATHPVGTGPYRLVEWMHDDRVVLERSTTFTLPAPMYDRVIWKVIPEASTRSAELIAGDVDLITNVAADQIVAINGSDTTHVETVTSVRRIYVGMNQREMFSATAGGRAVKDPAVRMAMQYAIDVPTICDALLRVPCKRAATMVYPRNDHSGIKAYSYDPDRAEKMLDAAGYPRGKDGVRFNIVLQAPRGLYGDTNVAMAVSQYLSDIGIKTEVQIMDISQYMIQTRTHMSGPLYLQGTGGSTWSPVYDLSDLSSSASGTNYTNWNDPEFFAGWAELQATRDPAAQEAIVNHMLEIFHERGPWLLLYFQPDTYGVRNGISWKPRADEIISLN